MVNFGPFRFSVSIRYYSSVQFKSLDARSRKAARYLFLVHLQWGAGQKLINPERPQATY